jgi:hypothetical protein
VLDDSESVTVWVSELVRGSDKDSENVSDSVQETGALGEFFVMESERLNDRVSDKLLVILTSLVNEKDSDSEVVELGVDDGLLDALGSSLAVPESDGPDRDAERLCVVVRDSVSLPEGGAPVDDFVTETVSVELSDLLLAIAVAVFVAVCSDEKDAVDDELFVPIGRLLENEAETNTVELEDFEWVGGLREALGSAENVRLEVKEMVSDVVAVASTDLVPGDLVLVGESERLSLGLRDEDDEWREVAVGEPDTVDVT